jgi:glycosyltransferase involved in cell wall biosynthesis
VAGVLDVVREEETGLLIKKKDVESIIGDIRDSLDGDTLGSLSSRGRRLAENEYSFDAAVERYRTLLNDLD